MRGQRTNPLAGRPGRSVASTRDRVEWLLKNPWLWERWAGITDPRWRDVVEAMRAAGLFARSTYWCDIKISNLIELARKERRTRAAGTPPTGDLPELLLTNNARRVPPAPAAE